MFLDVNKITKVGHANEDKSVAAISIKHKRELIRNAIKKLHDCSNKEYIA